MPREIARCSDHGHSQPPRNGHGGPILLECLSQSDACIEASGHDVRQTGPDQHFDHDMGIGVHEAWGANTSTMRAAALDAVMRT